MRENYLLHCLISLIVAYEVQSHECIVAWKNIKINNETRLARKAIPRSWDDEPYRRIWNDLENTAAGSEGSLGLHPYTSSFSPRLGDSTPTASLAVSGKRAKTVLNELLDSANIATTRQEKLELINELRRALGNSGVEGYTARAKRAIDSAMGVAHEATRSKDLLSRGYVGRPAGGKGILRYTPHRTSLKPGEVNELDQILFDFSSITTHPNSANRGGLIPVTFQKGSAGGSVKVKVFVIDDTLKTLRRILDEETLLLSEVKKLETALANAKKFPTNNPENLIKIKEIQDNLKLAEAKLADFDKANKIIKDRTASLLLDKAKAQLEDLNQRTNSQSLAISEIELQLDDLEKGLDQPGQNFDSKIEKIREILNPNRNLNPKAPQLEIDASEFNRRIR